MTLFTERAGRERNPLGGREADGFAQWLLVTEFSVREAESLARARSEASDPLRYVAISAARHYGSVLTEWQGVQAGRSDHVRDDLARDHFEVGLIAAVMSAYGAARFAQEQGHGHGGATAGGRPVADVSAEYLRACTILAKYVGVSELDVAACRDDQDALTALRNAGA